MKKLTLTCLGFLLFSGLWQPLQAQKLLTRTGHTWFESHTPIEDIEAHTHQTMSVLNTETGELAVAILIKGFQFEKALMQEHFNEKYMESDTYPKSTFSGKIVNLNEINFLEVGTYHAQSQGTLTIHGVSQEVEAEGTIRVSETEVGLKADFTVEVADYKIKIPSVVRDNIAKSISIFLDINFERPAP